jgi:two-component system sensor histidine kinase BaeS
MNRLVVRTLLAFLAALTILVAVMATASLLGFRRSVQEWDQARRAQLEALAEEILLTRPAAADVRVTDNTPLFVYDADGALVFSNRAEGGQGRGGGGKGGGGGTGTASERIPLFANGRLIGSYHAGEMRFRSDAANNSLLESLRWNLWLGLGLAFVISVPFALLFSRSLSAPAVRVARSLDRIIRGERAVEVPEKGAEEIALIARSANRLGRQIEREQELRRQWVHDITHDLRTPVAALKAQFEGMRDGVLDIGAERIGKNIREIARIEALISNLEELMRLESPEMRLSPQPIDPEALVEELRERLAHALEARGIAFEARVERRPFRGDPLLLQRALTNFASNAVRHCRDGGQIKVSVRWEGVVVRLAVFNTGEPIPGPDLPKVFDRLFRGEYARSSPGSGLGLTIARRIAELHGGEIQIANQDEGVLVEMSLPQEQEPLKAGYS